AAGMTASETFKALKARLALGVDLAAVKGLALLGIADDLVGGVELGETAGGLGVVLVGVRVQLLGELPERALDVRGACALGHPQHVIGVAHPCSPPGSLTLPCPAMAHTHRRCGEPLGPAQRLAPYARFSPRVRDSLADVQWMGLDGKDLWLAPE